MVLEITKFQTSDGKVFDTIEQAQRHEAIRYIAKKMQLGTDMMTDECETAVEWFMQEYVFVKRREIITSVSTDPSCVVMEFGAMCECYHKREDTMRLMEYIDSEHPRCPKCDTPMFLSATSVILRDNYLSVNEN